LGSDLIPEFLFLKNNKINKAEQYVDIWFKKIFLK
jgi:hypothetical protein